MRIYAVFGDNAVMIEYSYEHARYCLHKYFRGAHYTKPETAPQATAIK